MQEGQFSRAPSLSAHELDTRVDHLTRLISDDDIEGQEQLLRDLTDYSRDRILFQWRVFPEALRKVNEEIVALNDRLPLAVELPPDSQHVKLLSGLFGFHRRVLKEDCMEGISDDDAISSAWRSACSLSNSLFLPQIKECKKVGENGNEFDHQVAYTTDELDSLRVAYVDYLAILRSSLTCPDEQEYVIADVGLRNLYVDGGYHLSDSQQQHFVVGLIRFLESSEYSDLKSLLCDITESALSQREEFMISELQYSRDEINMFHKGFAEIVDFVRSCMIIAPDVAADFFDGFLQQEYQTVNTDIDRFPHSASSGYVENEEDKLDRVIADALPELRNWNKKSDNSQSTESAVNPRFVRFGVDYPIYDKPGVFNSLLGKLTTSPDEAITDLVAYLIHIFKLESAQEEDEFAGVEKEDMRQLAQVLNLETYEDFIWPAMQTLSAQYDDSLIKNQFWYGLELLEFNQGEGVDLSVLNRFNDEILSQITTEG